VLTWFAFFALGLSDFMGVSMFKAIQDGGGFLGGTFNVLGEATRYCILMILMGIICFQAPSLASALTGGAAIQQGIHMAQNAMMVSGRRSAAGARGAGPGAAGGVIRAGAGLPYTAGRATSVLATQTYGAARTAVRTAAYRLAALRGRP
jgi:type IV secretion system protein VirB6